MLKTYSKKLLLNLLFAGFLLSACTDKSVDLDNLSTDIRISGTYALPLLKESIITMRDILNESDSEIARGITLDTIADGTLALTCADSFAYNIGDDAGLNSGFADLKMEAGSLNLPGLGVISNALVGTPFTVPVTLDLSTIPATDGNSHEISYIHYYGGKMKFADLPDGVTVNKVTIGNVDYTVSNGEFAIPAQGITITSSPIDFEIVAQTAISEFAPTFGIDSPTSFQVGGKFKYEFGEGMKVNYNVDLSEFLGGSNLTFYDPRFDFTMESDGINVPLILVIKQLNDKVFSGKNGKGLELNIADASVSRDADIFANDAERNAYQSLLTTDEDSIKIVYSINTLDDGNIYYISSDASVKIRINAALPLWLNNGSYIVYSDTVKIDGESIKDEDFSFDDDTEITLRFAYENHLPFGLNLRMSLLDEAGAPLKIGSADYKDAGDGVSKATVDSEGNVSGISEGNLDLSLSKGEYDDLKNAGNLIIKYMSDKNSNVNTDKVKLKASDYLKIKHAGLILSGGITFNEN
jgi:hypothetical protein